MAARRNPKKQEMNNLLIFISLTFFSCPTQQKCETPYLLRVEFVTLPDDPARVGAPGGGDQGDIFTLYTSDLEQTEQAMNGREFTYMVFIGKYNTIFLEKKGNGWIVQGIELKTLNEAMDKLCVMLNEVGKYGEINQ